MKSTHRRVAAVVAPLVAAACLTVTAGTGAAWAGVEELTCGGTQTTHYSPGLRLDPREVTFTATSHYFPCVDLSGSGIVSGVAQLSNTQTASCLLTDAGLGRERIYWNTGKSSVVEARFTEVQHPVGQTVTITYGEVVSGPFKGHRSIRVLTTFSLDPLACLTDEGVTRNDGTVTLTFLP